MYGSWTLNEKKKASQLINCEKSKLFSGSFECTHENLELLFLKYFLLKQYKVRARLPPTLKANNEKRNYSCASFQSSLIFRFQNIKPLVSIGLYNNLNFSKNKYLCRIGFPVRLDSCYILTCNEEKSSPDLVDRFPKTSQSSEVFNIGKGGVWYYFESRINYGIPTLSSTGLLT